MYYCSGPIRKQAGSVPYRISVLLDLLLTHWQLLRVCISAANVTAIPGYIPQNASLARNGTFYTETPGWAYPSGATRWILVPSTFVAFSTIIVVLAALYRHPGDMPSDSQKLDPSNPLRLMSAAAAGGLKNSLS
jgi:hypothetical protein